ncbi:hypothetical protein AVEN_111481-1 [Araneus ventricosus]|uniref:Uncharacterized protein n=1 Tax=Araneus ventricosus TaxID=182803 RepID=A0A4Y2N150_ARAVE|nr:hypothetical protein AVEN_111481-1 [Araneus ventricosus]
MTFSCGHFFRRKQNEAIKQNVPISLRIQIVVVLPRAGLNPERASQGRLTGGARSLSRAIRKNRYRPCPRFRRRKRGRETAFVSLLPAFISREKRRTPAADSRRRKQMYDKA